MAPKAISPSSTTTTTCCSINNNINNDHESEYSETYNTTGNLSNSETPSLLIMENDFVQKMKSPSNENVLNFAFISFFGFTIFQFVFALMAKSQSLITDCAAQTVDCLTYLINCVAERLKNRADTPYEISSLSQADRDKRRKLRILILELVPPVISCTILLIVTIQSLSSAFDSILKEKRHDEVNNVEDGDDPEDDDDPNLNIMLLFSAINLVLDVVSVTCFANAGEFGIFLVSEPPTTTTTSTNATATADTTTTSTTEQQTQTQKDTKTSADHHPNENTALLLSQQQHHDNSNNNKIVLDAVVQQQQQQSNDINIEIDIKDDDLEEGSTVATTAADDNSMTDHSHDLNLNMCSAFTHIMADTLRSIAVLIAAGISYFYPSLLSPSDADSYGAVVVSIIIMLSVIPLIQGLFITASQIIKLLLQNYYHYYNQDQHQDQQRTTTTTKQKNNNKKTRSSDNKTTTTTTTIYSSCC